MKASFCCLTNGALGIVARRKKKLVVEEYMSVGVEPRARMDGGTRYHDTVIVPFPVIYVYGYSLTC